VRPWYWASAALLEPSSRICTGSDRRSGIQPAKTMENYQVKVTEHGLVV